jgi:hypothetical protein
VSTSILPADLMALASLPDDALIAVDQVAHLYACSVRHCWRAADLGLIPAPLPVGRLRRWRLGTLREHIRGGCRPVRGRARQ